MLFSFQHEVKLSWSIYSFFISINHKVRLSFFSIYHVSSSMKIGYDMKVLAPQGVIAICTLGVIVSPLSYPFITIQTIYNVIVWEPWGVIAICILDIIFSTFIICPLSGTNWLRHDRVGIVGVIAICTLDTIVLALSSFYPSFCDMD